MVDLSIVFWCFLYVYQAFCMSFWWRHLPLAVRIFGGSDMLTRADSLAASWSSKEVVLLKIAIEIVDLPWFTHCLNGDFPVRVLYVYQAGQSFNYQWIIGYIPSIYNIPHENSKHRHNLSHLFSGRSGGIGAIAGKRARGVAFASSCGMIFHGCFMRIMRISWDIDIGVPLNHLDMDIWIWRFPEIGVPLNHPIFMGFSMN